MLWLLLSWWDTILKLNFIVAYHIAYRYRLPIGHPYELCTYTHQQYVCLYFVSAIMSYHMSGNSRVVIRVMLLWLALA